jgi:polyisoprenoid-binding protein YceI
MSRRRMSAVVATSLVVIILISFLVVRQLVFGGTPTIHRTAKQGSPVPCASATGVPGEKTFAVDPRQSKATYTAHFQAAGQDLPGTVTGVTGDVTGTLNVSTGANPEIRSLVVTIGLATLNSGAPQRDDHVRNDTLQVSKYPVATFVAANAPILAGNYTNGQSASFKLPGLLTLHGVTRSVTFDMQGALAAGTISGFGTTVIHIADYQMQQPQITSVVTVTIQKDIGLRIDFVAHANQCGS